MTASPVQFPSERHDVESDQPAFLEPADTAAIDRGILLCPVTKGPKCGRSLFLLSVSLSLSLATSSYLRAFNSLPLYLSFAVTIFAVGVPASFEYQSDAPDLSEAAKNYYK